ncbi:MAG: hypothetical protein RLZZ141_43 [Pseudomonadota bacterium]
MIGWLERFIPGPSAMGYKELFRACFGVFLGLSGTAWISTMAMGDVTGSLLLIAPMGASAILIFAVPASPLAQPWPVVGGHLVAALVGVTTAHLISTPLLAAPLAVALSLGFMSLLRCVHPPSGAIALIAVLGGPKILELGYSFALVPVLLNSLLLTATALMYNNLSGRSYPHSAHGLPQPVTPTLSLTRDDIDTALKAYGETLDIDPKDLEGLVQGLVAQANKPNRAP